MSANIRKFKFVIDTEFSLIDSFAHLTDNYYQNINKVPSDCKRC